MKLVSKLVNILMPLEEAAEEPFDETQEEQQEHDTLKQQPDAQQQLQKSRKLGSQSVQSHLSVQSNNYDMKICIFKINAFDEVKSIADALNQKRAALVNYEKVDTETQKRICDFINGVCYVLDGEVKRISGEMVLYVPDNVSIGDGIVRGADGIFRNDIAS